VDGKALVAELRRGAALPRPPYIPILGRLAQVLGQVSEEAFTTDAATQCGVLAEAAAAVGADAITVGVGTPPAVAVDVVARLKPVAAGRALVGCLSAADVAGARAYCEAGVDLVFLLDPDRSNRGRFRTIANACAFYEVAALLVAPALDGAAAVAAELGLHGAVVAQPTGDEPGIVGGGLSAASVNDPPPAPPRASRFFWSFPDETPASLSPEDLAALGRRLTA